jgi:hypothetical protein
MQNINDDDVYKIVTIEEAAKIMAELSDQDEEFYLEIKSKEMEIKGIIFEGIYKEKNSWFFHNIEYYMLPINISFKEAEIKEISQNNNGTCHITFNSGLAYHIYLD